MTFPNVLTIAGSDSGGGAGIQADLKTFSALSTFGASVITALTAQNTRTVTAIHDVPADFVAAQLDAVFEDLAIASVKVGMLSQAEIIEAVAAGLERHEPKTVVVDPVMVAKSGAALLIPSAVDALTEHLLPRATVITPNLPEAGALLGRAVTEAPDDMMAAAQALRALGPQAVLLKGGHGTGPKSVDLLLTEAGVRIYEAPRIDTKNTHGTGCTLSSAVAAFLARGAPIEEAVERAKAFMTAALRAADRLSVGSGHGPVHHFHEYWRA